MQAIGTFLAGFSSNFKAALLMWPLLSFAFTLPILVYLYHRDGRLRLPTALAAYLTVLYIAGLGCFTLYPLPSGDSGPGITYGIEPQFNPLNFINDISRDGIKAVLQIVFNVVLFIPLGFIAKRLLRLRLPSTIAIAFATTCLIETAQLTGLFGIYPFAYRTFEVDDMIWNTLGGVVGWLLGRSLDRFIPKREDQEPEITNQPGFIRRCVALWVDLIIIGIGAGAPWMIAALFTEVVFGEALEFPGMNAAQTAGISVVVCEVVSFIIVEIIIPWRHGGSTPGGSLVRMTFETEQRSGWRRVLFYAVRAITLLVCCIFPQFMLIILAIFYFFAREMPYDYLPCDRQCASADNKGEKPTG